MGKGRRWLPTTPGTVSTPGRSAMGTTGSPTTEYLESVGTIPQDRSPPPAGIQPHPRMVRPCRSGKPPAPWGGSHAEEGSNFRPAVLETAALPTELSAYSWAGGIRTRVPGLNVRCSIPLSYSPAHMRRHDRRICGMRAPSPHGVAEDGVSSTVPTRFRVAGEACTKARPSVGRPDSNRHPLALCQLSYTPGGRRSTRPRLSNRHASASYWRSAGRKTIHGSAAARTRSRDPSTTESSPDRIRIRERFAGGAGLEPATYGSKDRRAAKLHHPPIPSSPARPRWSRFARPITRWTPSAGAGGDGHCPPVRHHALLGLPRQGGCRRGLNMCPMPAVILTPNGWRTLRTRPGFEPGSPPTEGGVLPLHQQATHTPIKQGVRPECRIRFHRQRQGTVRKLRFKRTVRWVTNPAVKPGRALPSIP